MQNNLVLGYWQLRGLGQRCILLLKYVGLPFSLQLYGAQSFESRPDWFQKRKPQMLKENPAANLPYLIDNQHNKTICESDAVLVYIVHKSGKLELLGRNGEQQVALHTVMGVFRNLYKNYLEMVYNPKSLQETKEESLKSMGDDLKKLSAILGANQYFCGGITWCDFVVAEFIEHIVRFQPNIKEQYKNLWEHQQRIWNLEQLKDYVNSQEFKAKPVNYKPAAKWY